MLLSVVQSSMGKGLTVFTCTLEFLFNELSLWNRMLENCEMQNFEGTQHNVWQFRKQIFTWFTSTFFSSPI
jgi:hypothetical protein